MATPFTVSLLIRSTPARLWQVLTSPDCMQQWMGEAEMQISIETSWKVNTPIIIKGVHHGAFVNDGIVLAYSREQRLTYNARSSVSQLPDAPASYCVIDFILTPENDHTLLTLTVSNFPTDVIQKHYEFYWRGTMQKIKSIAERLY